MKIVVIGSSVMEIIITAPCIPLPGQNITGSEHEISPGGRGVRQAVAAARAGAGVSFISRTGDDAFAARIFEFLAAEKINATGIVMDKNLPTGISAIVFDDNGQNCVTTAPGANAGITIGDIDREKEVIADSDLLLLQLDVPAEVVMYAARLARRSGKKVILNPSPEVVVSDELLKYVSVLAADALEAEALTGIHITDDRSSELAGRILLERGVDRVIITTGSRGAMVVDNGGAENVAGFGQERLNDSSVNDIFNGALAAALAEDKNFYKAVSFANAAVSISMSRKSGISSIPFRNEILRLAKK